MVGLTKSKSFICLRDVRKVYETAAGGHPALRGISLDVARGEFLSITGKSGAGKSTLVNMIAGVDGLTSGEVRIGGISIHDLDESERAQWRGRTVGVVYQSFELLPQLSLLDNVLLPMDVCGLYRGRKSIVRAQQLLERVGLRDHMHKPPTRISGGQKQRVAIARALANDPEIIVADEPTGNLDSATADEVFSLFLGLVETGKTIVMVTHDRSLANLTTRTLEIRDGVLVDSTGRVVEVSSPAAHSLLPRVPILVGGGDD